MSGFFLQSLNLRTDGGLRGIQQPSRVRKSSGLCDGYEITKQPGIKHEQMLPQSCILEINPRHRLIPTEIFVGPTNGTRSKLNLDTGLRKVRRRKGGEQCVHSA